MNKSMKFVGALTLVAFLVFGVASCGSKAQSRRGTGEFDGTLITANNAAFTVEVEINGEIKKADLAAGAQWTTQLYQGPYDVKIRNATDNSGERQYDVNIIAGATVTIRYP